MMLLELEKGENPAWRGEQRRVGSAVQRTAPDRGNKLSLPRSKDGSLSAFPVLPTSSTRLDDVTPP